MKLEAQVHGSVWGACDNDGSRLPENSLVTEHTLQPSAHVLARSKTAGRNARKLGSSFRPRCGGAGGLQQSILGGEVCGSGGGEVCGSEFHLLYEDSGWLSLY